MTRRVFIGKRPDGTVGLSVSLPGVDVVTADFNAGGFSFDDRWTDIVKIALVGTANAPTGSFTPGTYPSPVVSHGLGYVPFVEARLLPSSNVLNDDWFDLTSFAVSNRLSGVPVTVDTSNITFLPQQSGPLSSGVEPFAGYNSIYIIYAIPVPNPS